ncbi:MAG: metallophosphoesterase [Ferruginibacter sp.]|nr:metallophosphoesterase [Ferruginibacter sp.]
MPGSFQLFLFLISWLIFSSNNTLLRCSFLNYYTLTRIGLLSDTHHFLDDAIFQHFKTCDEIWHAGDFGTMEIAEKIIEGFNLPVLPQPVTKDGLTSRPTIFSDRLKGVYGNIDGPDIRKIFPEQLVFMCEEVKVMMRHIGGYPPKYNPITKKEILAHRPQLFISGHSHILKVMYDEKLGCLHMNPGAAGKQGWHKVRTLLRFVIDGKEMKNCEVIELI